MTRKIYAAILALGLSSLSSIDAGAQVNVTTWHNDLARTGANTQESTLTTANVNINTFGKLFTTPIDGKVFAQPLYLSGVSIGGGTHNVVYVATEHDSVYAIDADSGTIYAQVSLIPPGGTTLNSTTDLNCGDVNPEVGITGTPVIDPVSNILYVVANVKVNGNIAQVLHALSTNTLAEMLNGPVEIDASVPGTAPDGNGTTLVFNPVQQLQRSGLALVNGHVVIAWGSHCDLAPYHGWVMSYEADSLAQEAVWSTTPDQQLSGSTQTPQGGIWMAGGAPVVDADGNIYVTSANGNWDGIRDFADSVLKLGAPANNTFPLLDYFTPFDLGGPGDSDVGSAGLMLLPTTTSGAQRLLQQGKQGTVYLMDHSNLGHNCAAVSSPCTSGDTQISQELRGATAGAYSSPVYWNGNVFMPNGNVSAWSVDPSSGLISSAPTSQTTQKYARNGAASLSANGSTNGIVWFMHNTAELFAFDATNLANILWSSGQANGGRDRIDSSLKFEPPTIANGKVYYGSQTALYAMGLLGGGSTSTATPTFLPAGGTYTATQSVTISDTTSGATIFYTTNGTTPTTSSTQYTGPISVSSSETIQAIATASGLANSAVNSATYTILQGTTNTPTFLPAGGTYTATPSVTISDTTSSATIFYTTNGTTPTTSSTQYTGPISVSSSETIKAIAAASGFANSAVGSATYTIQQGTTSTPTFSPAGGTYTTTQSVTISDTTSGATIYYTTNGTQPTTSSTVYTGLITVSASETLQAIAVASGQATSALATAVYTINSGGGGGGSGTTVVNYPAGFSSATGFTLNGGATVAVGVLQVTDGGTYENRTIWYSTPVNVQSFTTDFTFQMTPAASNIGDGMTFTIQNQGLTARGGVGGSLGYQDVKPSVAVKFDVYSNSGEGPNSTGIYVNGVAPILPATDLTPSGVNLHSGHVMQAHLTYDGTTLTLSLTDTVTNAAFTMAQAINIPSTVGANTAYVGFTGGTGGSVITQSILSWTYQVNGSSTPPPPATTATPSLSLVSGTYTGPQSVTISDSTPSASIYYTTDGSTPTPFSTAYTGLITVSSSATIQAIATASGLANSAVGSATYTIQQGTTSTPTFLPVGGTYTAAQSVTISDTTSGATIYYTTNGTTPTTASTAYTGPITVSSSETIKAIAAASGFANSAVGSATYTIQQGTTSTPTFLPVGGTYTTAQSVTISDTTSGATIYYTTDGSQPTTSSTAYVGPITVSSSETLQAIAVASGQAASGVTTAVYTINLGGGGGGSSTTPVNYPAGFSSATGFTLNGGATVAAGTLQLSDGATYENRTIWYSTPVNVQSFTSDFTFQITPAVSNIADGMTFAIQNQGLTARGGVGSGLGYQSIKTSVAVKFDVYSNSSEGVNSTGFYLNGAAPTTPATDLTPSGVNLHSGHVMHAHLTYDGTTLALALTDTVTNATFTMAQAINIPSTVGANTAYVGFTAGTGGSVATQNILSWTYQVNGSSTPPPPATTATPTLSPAGGTYTASQAVTILDSTPGAKIYYTTDGTTPTPSSTLYTGAITVSSSETIQAIATASGLTNSAMGSATYTIKASTPTLSPAGGTYTATQSVSILDSTSGAKIYYTTDGTTPTPSSTLYTGPITLSNSATIQAIAGGSGLANSAVGSATYTILQGTTNTPTFLPVAGTYTATQSVTISDTTSGATIYYTTNGTAPTTASTVYAGPISVSASATLQAIAVASGKATSGLATAVYTINPSGGGGGGSGPTPVNYPAGFTSATGFTLNGGATVAAGTLQVTDGGTYENRTIWYSTPVNIQKFTTDFTFQITPAAAKNIADGMTFAIQNKGLTARGGVGGALGYQDVKPSVAVKFDLYSNSSEGVNSTGFYLNGVAPMVPAIDLTPSGVNLHSGHVMHAHLTYDGTTLTLSLTDTVTNASFTGSQAINIPSTVGANTAYVGFTGGTGGSVATQNVLSWTYQVN